jgi:hypothetical protein
MSGSGAGRPFAGSEAMTAVLGRVAAETICRNSVLRRSRPAAPALVWDENTGPNVMELTPQLRVEIGKYIAKRIELLIDGAADHASSTP